MPNYELRRCPSHSVVDLVGVNPPYYRSFQGGLLGNVGGSAIAPGVSDSAVDATKNADRSFLAGFAKGEMSCASPRANPLACLPPVAVTAVPDGELRAPDNMQWILALEHQAGTDRNLRAQYVGTRVLKPEANSTQGKSACSTF